MFTNITDINHLLILCAFCTKVEVTPFLLHESYNIRLQDSGSYKIDEFVNENDYEMIKDNEIEQFRIHDKENKLFALNKLASKEYEKNLKSKEPVKEWFQGTQPTVPAVTDETIVLYTAYHSQKSSHNIFKRDVSNKTTIEYLDYDYKGLVKEYYDETLEKSHSNHTYHAKPKNESKSGVISSVEKAVKFDTKTKNCTEEEIKHIGFKAVYCIFQDYRHHKQPSIVLAKRLGRIIKIWFIVYIIIATPLWCTRGWCCCCLFCKFFKPRVTIENAKKYLVMNPPGFLKATKGSDTEYQPTEYEIQSYEEFEHLIKTI